MDRLPSISNFIPPKNIQVCRKVCGKALSDVFSKRVSAKLTVAVWRKPS
jgi:hypothetical protein